MMREITEEFVRGAENVTATIDRLAGDIGSRQVATALVALAIKVKLDATTEALRERFGDALQQDVYDDVGKHVMGLLHHFHMQEQVRKIGGNVAEILNILKDRSDASGMDE
jgi:hypothetical protein